MKAIYLTQPVIRLSYLRLVLFSVIFMVLAVAAPWLAHQFNLAGQTFLPMHFFVLVAALAFGWKVGLFVGVLTPLVSYFTSGMPLIATLPYITVEIIFYGLTAGILREKFDLNIWSSLILAMVIGRLALGITTFILEGINPLIYIFQVVKIGLPGILMQLILVVPVANLIIKWIK